MEQKVNKIINEIKRLSAQKEHILVAIDGKCGAGKTTLSAELQKRLQCTVFHMDDFFLRPEQRTEERLKTAGENIDHERFLEEVLLPLSENRPVIYRTYDCSSQTLSEPIEKLPCSVTITEGSYSCHPKLWDYYDLHVFMDVDSETQYARIILRSGLLVAEIYKKKWIPLEEDYFHTYMIKEKCEICI